MLISIIVINYNNVLGLKKTLFSCVSQDYQEKEIIVIDGKSSDASPEVIRCVEDQISFWSSEKDLGIYDAMNKGILHCHGEFVIFMNSGDCFAKADVISSVFQHPQAKTADIVYGNTRMVTTDGLYIDQIIGKIEPNLGNCMPGCHQSIFVRTVLHKNNPFDLSYKIASDIHFFYSIFDGKKKYFYAPLLVSYFEIGGTSSNGYLRTMEYARIYGIHISHIKNIFYKIYFFIFNILLKVLPIKILRTHLKKYKKLN